MGKVILGPITLEIVSADCANLLNKISAEKIFVRNILYQSDIQLTLTISGCDYSLLRQIVQKSGGTIRMKHFSGMHQYIRNAAKHPVLWVTLSILLLISIFVPRKVLFISVSGNTGIPSERIIEAAGECGLRFGVNRRSIRSEVIKNALLEKIPQLQWAGINTKGCTAVISVREKTVQKIDGKERGKVSSIVASRDGIIQNCTVYQGTPLCVTGQAVKAGELLVSGYTDCGLLVKATQAEAEVSALTFRNLELLAPSPTVKRGLETYQKNSYAIKIGKKLINLSKDSGNIDTGCDKIYVEKSVRLPGGFQLPISLIKTTSVYYEEVDCKTLSPEYGQWLEDFSVAYIKRTMVAGSVISAESTLMNANGISSLQGRYTCIEMIGQVKYEQTLLKD